MGDFRGFRLYHDPDERFRAGGTDNDGGSPLQRIGQHVRLRQLDFRFAAGD